MNIPQPPSTVVVEGGYFKQLDEYAKKFGDSGWLSAYSRSKDCMVYCPVKRLDFRLVTHRPGKWCVVEDIPGLISYRDLLCCWLPHQLLIDGLQSNTPVGFWTPDLPHGAKIVDTLGEIG